MTEFDKHYSRLSARDVDEYTPLSTKQSMRFWSIFGFFMLIDLASILLISYGLDHGWYV